MDGREYIEMSYSEECSNWSRNFLAGDITKLEQFLSMSGSYTPLSGLRLVYACKVAKNVNFRSFPSKVLFFVITWDRIDDEVFFL